MPSLQIFDQPYVGPVSSIWWSIMFYRFVGQLCVTDLSVLVDAGSHELSGLVVDGEDGEAVAASDVLHVQHLDLKKFLFCNLNFCR